MFSTKPLRGEICGLSLYRKANPRYSRASLGSVLGCFSSLVIVHRHCYLMGRGGGGGGWSIQLLMLILML